VFQLNGNKQTWNVQPLVLAKGLFALRFSLPKIRTSSRREPMLCFVSMNLGCDSPIKAGKFMHQSKQTMETGFIQIKLGRF
jgi:hypothetical protein